MHNIAAVLALLACPGLGWRVKLSNGQWRSKQLSEIRGNLQAADAAPKTSRSAKTLASLLLGSKPAAAFNTGIRRAHFPRDMTSLRLHHLDRCSKVRLAEDQAGGSARKVFDSGNKKDKTFQVASDEEKFTLFYMNRLFEEEEVDDTMSDAEEEWEDADEEEVVSEEGTSKRLYPHIKQIFLEPETNEEEPGAYEPLFPQFKLAPTSLPSTMPTYARGSTGVKLSPTGGELNVELFLDFFNEHGAAHFRTVYDQMISKFGDKVSFTVHEVIDPSKAGSIWLHQACAGVFLLSPEQYPAYVRRVVEMYELGAFELFFNFQWSGDQVYTDLVRAASEVGGIDVEKLSSMLAGAASGMIKSLYPSPIHDRMREVIGYHRSRLVTPSMAPLVMVNGKAAGRVTKSKHDPSTWDERDWTNFVE